MNLNNWIEVNASKVLKVVKCYAVISLTLMMVACVLLSIECYRAGSVHSTVPKWLSYFCLVVIFNGALLVSVLFACKVFGLKEENI